MAKKPSGLNKKVSSIFAGIPDLEGTPPPAPPKPARKPPAKRLTSEIPVSKIRNYFLNLLAFGQRKRLMFDIGMSRIKAVLMVNRAGNWAVEAAEDREFSIDARGNRERDENEIVEAIRDVADTLDPERKAQVGLILTAPNVFLTVTKAPDQPKREWKEALAWELADSAHFPIEEAALLWTSLRGQTENKLLDDRVLVAAVHDEERESVIDAFRKADLKLETITPLSSAVESLMHMHAESARSVSLVIDIGAENTRCYFFYQGTFLYMRQFSFGSDIVNKALTGTIQVDQERIEIGFKEAAALVQEYQLLSNVTQMDPNQPKRSQLAARLRPLMEKLVGEIRRSLSYFQSELAIGNVERAFLIGGGSGIAGIDRLLASELAIPVTKLDTTRDFGLAVDRQMVLGAPTFPLTFGPVLGLGRAISVPLNFADWQDRWQPLGANAKRWLGIASLGVIILGVFGTLAFTATAGTLRLEQIRIEDALEREGAQIDKLKEFDRLSEDIRARKDRLGKAVGLEPLWAGLLRELSHLLPHDMILDRLEVEGSGFPKAMILNGYVRSSSVSSDTLISNVLGTLNQSPYFSGAKLLSRTQTEAADTSQSVFSIRVVLA